MFIQIKKTKINTRKTNMKKIVLSSLIASTLLVSAHAEEAKVTPLKTHAELGYIETNGNTSTKTFNADVTAKKSWGKHQGKIAFDGQYSKDSGVETKNKYLVELNYNYAITKRFAFDYLVGYKADKFSGFTYQLYTGPGAIYKVLVSKQQNLTLEGNILYAQDQYDDIGTVSGAKEDYASYRVKAAYDYAFSKTVKFNQELTARGQLDDMPNYFAYSKSSLTAKLSDVFSAGLSYKVDYVNHPPVDKDTTDTTLTLNLIADF
jgi:putative salt-induced outer membrane protein